jgi:hypothetical protein
MNNGERNELIIKLRLIQLRDKNSKIKINSKLTKINSVGFLNEYKKLPGQIDFDKIIKYSDNQLEKIAIQYGIGKAPAKSKSDVFVNGIGISLKSIENAPPAIVNHTPRTGFETACNICGSDITLLDEIISEYWSLRKRGKIKEDIHNTDLNSPFKNNKEILKPILNYFLFDGSGKGLSNHRASLILDYNSPINHNSWETYNRDNAVDMIWTKLVFSLRSKGMPKRYPNIENIKSVSIKKWTNFFQDKYKGALHIRTK